MTPTDAARRARELGFVRHDAIERLARVSGAFMPARSRGKVVSGHSVLGGLPTGIHEAAWPRRAGESLAFIAQIQLAELPAAVRAQGLPTEGSLLFFYDANQRTWGFDPSDAGSAVVLFVGPDGRSSAPSAWPSDLPEHARYRAVPIEFEGIATLPPSDSVLVDELALTEEQLSIYMDLCEALAGDDAWSHRGLVGGHPDQIQGDMTLECALVSAGLSCGDAKAYHPRLPRFRRDALDWRLLLQVPSANDAGMMWGDAGCLYFWIREQDLNARNFAASWMVLQCG